MQKKYKNYLIKSTANNKRYKLYYNYDPNMEIFTSQYLSDVMAFIKIEEDEMSDTDGILDTLKRLGIAGRNFDTGLTDAEEASIEKSKYIVNPDWTPEKAADALEQLNNMAKKRRDIKKPVVKNKISMKMKKKK